MSESKFIQRKKNLQFSKERALDILEKGGTPLEVWTSFLSDMNNDEATRNHPALKMGMMLLAGEHLSDPEVMRNHIEGYN